MRTIRALAGLLLLPLLVTISSCGTEPTTTDPCYQQKLQAFLTYGNQPRTVVSLNEWKFGTAPSQTTVTFAPGSGTCTATVTP